MVKKMVKKSEKVPEPRAHPVLEKITKWVFPIFLPLMAILVGIMLHNAIIDKSTISLVLNILSCIIILTISFLTSRSLMHLGEIKAHKEIKEILESLSEMSQKGDKQTSDTLRQGKCPCGGRLLAGPRGGLSQMGKCDTCGTEYTVHPWPFECEKH